MSDEPGSIEWAKAQLDKQRAARTSKESEKREAARAQHEEELRQADPLGYPENVTLETLVAEVMKLRTRVDELESEIEEWKSTYREWMERQ